MESTLYQIIGSRIRAAREQKGWTQTELSTRINLTRTSIANIEAGRQKIPIDTLYDICELLLTSPQRILPTADEIREEEFSPSAIIETDQLSPDKKDFILKIIKKGIYDEG